MTFLDHLYMIGLAIGDVLIPGLVTGEFRIVELNVNFAGYKHWPISGQCSQFIPPENTRKPLVYLRGYKMGTQARNVLTREFWQLWLLTWRFLQLWVLTGWIRNLIKYIQEWIIHVTYRPLQKWSLVLSLVFIKKNGNLANFEKIYSNIYSRSLMISSFDI